MTIQNWRNRSSTASAPVEPKRARPTVLTPDEEAHLPFVDALAYRCSLHGPHKALDDSPPAAYLASINRRGPASRTC